jgi:tetratricopeptide (TPR) repeat protein/SAM-dependent methyltransferase
MLTKLKSLFPARFSRVGGESGTSKRQGDKLLKLDRLDEAAECYRRALSTAPDYVDAWVGLAFVLGEQKQYSEAEECLRRVSSIQPGIADAHYMLGTLSRKQNDLAASIDHYAHALDIKPDFEFAYRDLFAALIEVGELQKAMDVLGRAISIYPESAEFQFHLGNLLCRQEDFVNAIVCYQKALSLQPDSAETHKNLAEALRRRGQVDLAVASYQNALFLEPEDYLTRYRLGVSLHDLGQLAEAEWSYRGALALKPDYSEAKAGLAFVLRAQGRAQDAIELHFDLLTDDPTNPQLRRILAESLRGIAIKNDGEKERNILLSLCVDDDVSMQFLITAIIALIKGDEGFQALQNKTRKGEDPFTTVIPAVAAFLRAPLLLTALPRMPIADTEIEAVLEHMRRHIVLRSGVVSGLAVADPDIPAEFLCAIARQCFFSEYALFADESELQRVVSLREALQGALREANANPRALERSLATSALYDPLHTLKGCERLLGYPKGEWSDAFRPIVEEQIENRKREQEIAARLTSITAIDDETSVAVRAQYEENPYPLWVSAQSPGPETIEALSGRLRPGQEVRVRPRPVPILVAGCGTGHHSVQVARAYPDSEILAVDLSLASLAYAARMTARLGIYNITYRQADILKLDKLDRRFAVVECGGVLHHLDDPMAGWRALVTLLESDGLMKIALYSEKARSSVRAARQFIRSMNFPPTPDGIRHCRHVIAALPDGHPARKIMTFTDFFTVGEFRDLAMHVQEHQFTLSHIAECLDQLGLQFLGLECAETTRRRFKEMFPDRDADINLEAWDQFENVYPETFRGMYPFWCCRK